MVMVIPDGRGKQNRRFKPGFQASDLHPDSSKNGDFSIVGSTNLSHAPGFRMALRRQKRKVASKSLPQLRFPLVTRIEHKVERCPFKRNSGDHLEAVERE